MELNRYKDLSQKEHEEQQQIIHKKTFWFNSGEYAGRYKDHDLYVTPEDQINKSWMNPASWFIPEVFVYKKMTGEFAGEYYFSIYTLLSKDFEGFKSTDSLKNEILDLKELSKQRLLDKKNEIIEELRFLHHDQQQLLNKAAGRIEHFIKEKSVLVYDYTPHSNEGENTFKMGALIEDAELAFRGVVCGSEYAYECLINRYLGEALTKKLWENQKRIIYISKEYLALQIAIEHYDHAGNPTITESEIEWFTNLLKDLKHVERNNDSVTKYFKDKVPGFIGNPAKNYFRGGLNKSFIGESLSEIYKIKFGKDLSAKSFITKFIYDMEKLRED